MWITKKQKAVVGLLVLIALAVSWGMGARAGLKAAQDNKNGEVERAYFEGVHDGAVVDGEGVSQ